MALYLITYDLNKPGQDYKALYSKIKSIAGTGNYIHPLDSTWIISTTKTAVEIRDDLKSATDWNDKLFVCRCPKWAWSKLDKSDIDWLHDH